MALARSPRLPFALAALACAALLGFGYWLQYGKGLEPCPLCLVQRGFYYGILGASLLVFLPGAGVRTAIAAASAVFVFAAGGLATAGRQVWLQHLPKDRLPACGPDLSFMLENFPLADALRMLVRGSGQCAEVDWTFLGLSIAEWSLGWFALFALGALLTLVRALLPGPVTDAGVGGAATRRRAAG